MTIIVAGASGLLGTALVRALRDGGEQVTRLVRRAPRQQDESFWDPRRGEVDAAVLEGADAVVNLAGAGVGDRRWSEPYKKEIVDSRVDSTRTLVQALVRLSRPPEVFVSASGVDYYGDTGDRLIDESAPKGRGFMADLCERWEGEAAGAVAAGIRTVQLRTGLVLSREGGALARMLPVFRLGLGAPLGSGRQYWSWISIDDWVGAAVHILKNREISGPTNMVSENPVTNAEFTRQLAKAMRRPMMPLPVPKFALHLGLGEFADEALLSSHRIVPKKLADNRYAFRHTHLDRALAAVL
ncbi:TIGR01777 family oxidoreductase [Thermoactinospora rubra]|uniref:TIGR01777 family oxidoreductase n=1 Tax=Thermoactinospora rubra TaxID=1088767 RepID=UPI000A109C8A|nr:TIGR01777 family oxidoreductase [Thermoactinospora rubra]